MSFAGSGSPTTARVRRRVSLVTGGTDGIGRAVAVELARRGERVLFVGRNEERGAQVLGALHAIAPCVRHQFLRADLSLLGETARVAEQVALATDRLDAAVFCAGVLSMVPRWTLEGLERNFVLNYLSRYLLGRRLLPLLAQAPSGRLVLVANAGVYKDTLDFDDLQYRRGRPGLNVSGRTQFANDLFVTELADRVRGSRVEVFGVFPGVTATSVFRNAEGLPWLARTVAPTWLSLFAQPPHEAAQTPVYLARGARLAGRGGRFFGPRLRERTVPARAQRLDRRNALWLASQSLVHDYLLPAHALPDDWTVESATEAMPA